MTKNQEEYRTIDPKTLLIIGNKKIEFPSKLQSIDNSLKRDTFERFRRNSRNIEILTYDELYERAFHIVNSEKINDDWYFLDDQSCIE